MSLSSPSDTSSKPQVAEAPDASKAHPSIGQRILNAIFFWILLPRNYAALCAAYTEMIRQDMELAKRVRYLSQKMNFYETQVPWLGDLHKRFVAEMAGGDVNSLTDGILIPANGDKKRRVISLS